MSLTEMQNTNVQNVPNKKRVEHVKEQSPQPRPPPPPPQPQSPPPRPQETKLEAQKNTPFVKNEPEEYEYDELITVSVANAPPGVPSLSKLQPSEEQIEKRWIRGAPLYGSSEFSQWYNKKFPTLGRKPTNGQQKGRYQRKS